MKKLLFLIGILSFFSMAAFAFNQTKIISFSPFKDHQVSKQFKIKKILTGKCWSSAAISGRQDVLRCMVGNGIYDPCFQLNNKQAFCLSEPWVRDGVLVQLQSVKQKAIQHAAPQKAIPWAVKLKSGARCVMLTGATFGIQNKRANYACDDGSYLIGQFNRSSTLWTIEQIKIKKAAVKTVWR